MDNLITVEPIKTEEATSAIKKVFTFLGKVATFKIASQIDYDDVARFTQEVKSRYRTLDAQRKEITNPLTLAKSKVMELFRPPLEALKNAEDLLKNKMDDYDAEQNAIHEREQEKLRKQAEAEETQRRKVLEEQARHQEEKAAELRRQAEEADAKEKEHLEEQATRAEERAEARREAKEEVHIEAPVLAPRTEKPKGVSYREDWTAEVVDFSKLPDPYKVANLPMLNRHALNTKGQVPILGVVFHSKRITAVRKAPVI